MEVRGRNTSGGEGRFPVCTEALGFRPHPWWGIGGDAEGDTRGDAGGKLGKTTHLFLPR